MRIQGYSIREVRYTFEKQLPMGALLSNILNLGPEFKFLMVPSKNQSMVPFAIKGGGMRLSVKATTMVTALLWGASMLFIGLINLVDSSYGVEFLKIISSL